MNFEPNVTEQWRNKYNNFYYTDGYLYSASKDEFCSNKQENINYDYRTGHFSERNHKIIAEKLENLILNNEVFNLDKDLHKNFI